MFFPNVDIRPSLLSTLLDIFWYFRVKRYRRTQSIKVQIILCKHRGGIIMRGCSKNFMWIHLFNPHNFGGWYHHLSHFIHDISEAQRGWVTWAKLQSSWVVELGFETQTLVSRVCALNPAPYCLPGEWRWEKCMSKNQKLGNNCWKESAQDPEPHILSPNTANEH